MSEFNQYPVRAAKQELRRVMRKRLRGLSAEERLRCSQGICEAIAKHPAYVEAAVVGMFDPLPSEPLVELLWERAPKRFLYPRIAGDSLEMVEVRSLGELRQHVGFGFREPMRKTGDLGGGKAGKEEVGGELQAADLNLILVPGLAFTRGGERLGRGGGYYDRLLASRPSRTVKLGVCFEMQVVEQMATEPHDVRLDGIVTERD